MCMGDSRSTSGLPIRGTTPPKSCETMSPASRAQARIPSFAPSPRRLHSATPPPPRDEQAPITSATRGATLASRTLRSNSPWCAAFSRRTLRVCGFFAQREKPRRAAFRRRGRKCAAIDENGVRRFPRRHRTPRGLTRPPPLSEPNVCPRGGPNGPITGRALRPGVSRNGIQRQDIAIVVCI